MGDLLTRLAAELSGPAPAGTRTLPGSPKLLRAAREIEAACTAEPAGAELLVGFQRAEAWPRRRPATAAWPRPASR